MSGICFRASIWLFEGDARILDYASYEDRDWKVFIGSTKGKRALTFGGLEWSNFELRGWGCVLVLERMSPPPPRVSSFWPRIGNDISGSTSVCFKGFLLGVQDFAGCAAEGV